MALKICTYNCKGFNISKVKHFKHLLSECDILLVQETWALKDQVGRLNRHFDDYNTYGVSGINEDVLLKGRPYGGVSFLYKKSISPYVQPSPAFLNAINAAAPAQGDANMGYQMPSIQPSPAPQKFINSAFSTGPPPSDACVSYQISSLQPALESMIISATSIPTARGDANISYEMTSCQPSPTLMHEINSAATKLPIRGDANMCYDMASSLSTPGLYDFPNFVKPTTTAPKRNAGISKDAKQRLNNWYECNKHHPYANAEATRMLARTCNISVVQVRKWFNNKRMRSKRPKTQTAPNNEIDCGFITVQIVCK